MADRKKTEGHCSTGQSPQWAVVPVEGEDEDIHTLDADLFELKFSSKSRKNNAFSIRSKDIKLREMEK